MHVRIPTKELSESMSVVAGIVQRKESIPILSHTLLTAKSGAIQIAATDLATSVTRVCSAEVMTEGATTVPTTMLNDIVRRSRGDVIEMMAQPGDSEALAHMQSGSAKFAVPVLDPRDFPNIDKVGIVKSKFTLDAKRFAEVIGMTKHAVGTDQSRLYLHGGLLHVHKDRLRLICANGHILAMVDMDLPAGAETLAPSILPTSLLTAIAKLGDKTPETVLQVEINASRVRLTLGKTVITSVLVEGIYPDYLRIVPTTSSTVMTVPAADLAATVDRVRAIAGNSAGGTGLKIGPDGLLVYMNGRHGAAAEDRMPAAVEGGEVQTGFAPAYIIDTMGAISGDAVWSLRPGEMPALITSVEEPDATFVLMPLRVS